MVFIKKIDKKQVAEETKYSKLTNNKNEEKLIKTEKNILRVPHPDLRAKRRQCTGGSGCGGFIFSTM